MIQAYVDDSGGKGQGEVFVFSALIATAETWLLVVDRWEACLQESPSVRYFKMDEAAGLSGEFRGFTKEQRDEKIKRLCRIINSPELTELSCTLFLRDFNESWAHMLGRPACEPYFYPFQVINSAVGAEMWKRGLREPAEIFFDEQVIFGPRAKAWYPVLRASYPLFFQELMPVEPLFRSDIDVIPLQAADLTAWMHRNGNESGLGEFQWLIDELNLLRPSLFSQVVDQKFIDKMLSYERTPADLALGAQVLESYRDIFGHEWPPKNKLERKKHTGRL